MNNAEQTTDLKIEHELAIDLKLMGFRYSMIAGDERINVTEHTIRTWFMRGGICYNAYLRKKRLLARERKEMIGNIDNQVKDLIIDAMNCLSEAVKKGNLQAAIKAIELYKIYQEQRLLEEKSEDSPLIRVIREAIDRHHTQHKAQPSQTPTETNQINQEPEEI